MRSLAGALRRAGPPAGPHGSHGADVLDWISCARSHVGHRRQINEDRVLDCPERGLWAVADGMGGHRGGDVAAEIVIAALRDLAGGSTALDGASIEGALQDANRQIRSHALSAGGVIGSTVVVLHLSGTTAMLYWAGDSRAYRVRQGTLHQLTRDHSLVQELVDAGLISIEAAGSHPQANVVTRALGVEDLLAIERASVSVQQEDLLLLCSDGLSRTLSEDAMQAEGDGGAAFADRLLQTALVRDGSDNISFVTVDVRASAPSAD